jgi:lipoprotein NlpD
MPVASAQSSSAALPAATSATEDAISFQWPARGNLIAGFDESKNKGLDIGGKVGDPVSAAADGRVVYAGAGLRGYGNLIILKHNNTYLTAYAHNQTLLVKEDQVIKRGQKIAEMGNSDADQVKLHFEIRRQGKPVDPAKYLSAN